MAASSSAGGATGGWYAGTIQTQMILGIVFVEALGILAFVISIMLGLGIFGGTGV